MHEIDSSLIEVKIHDVARGGSGVGKLASGEIVFVPFTATGDVVKVRILKKTKNFSHAELVEVVEPSPERIRPLCPIFGQCGGCDWQHLPYPLQFSIKKSGLLQSLKRIGVATDPIKIDEMPAPEPYAYRNRIQLRGNTVDKTFGFHAKNTNQIVPLEKAGDQCVISDKKINEAIPGIRKEAFALSQATSPHFKVEIEISFDQKVRYVFNEKHGALGFRQVNDAQNARLQRWVSDHAGEKGLLLDLYGGHGNLSLNLVDRFTSIRCVDLSAPTHRSSALPANFEFVKSDVSAWLKKQSGSVPQKTTVILDPPREGLNAQFSTIEAYLDQYFSPERVILIGCDVDSFTRDTKGFLERGYRLEKLGILDLFPQTIHVESLALFVK